MPTLPALPIAPHSNDDDAAVSDTAPSEDPCLRTRILMPLLPISLFALLERIAFGCTVAVVNRGGILTASVGGAATQMDDVHAALALDWLVEATPAAASPDTLTFVATERDRAACLRHRENAALRDRSDDANGFVELAPEA